jgi:hypothetical protein
MDRDNAPAYYVLRSIDSDPAAPEYLRSDFKSRGPIHEAMRFPSRKLAAEMLAEFTRFRVDSVSRWEWLRLRRMPGYRRRPG